MIEGRDKKDDTMKKKYISLCLLIYILYTNTIYDKIVKMSPKGNRMSTRTILASILII